MPVFVFTDWIAYVAGLVVRHPYQSAGYLCVLAATLVVGCAARASDCEE